MGYYIVEVRNDYFTVLYQYMTLLPSVVSVRLTESDYRLLENEGSTQVCVMRVGESAQEITVIIIAEEVNPQSAEGESNYSL